MRIAFLAVDDEFAGEMQRFVYEAHPDWIVGSVLSSCAIYKHSRLSGALFVARRSGLAFLAEMTRMKIVRAFLDRKRRCFPSRLAQGRGVEQFTCSNINDPASIEKLRQWRPDLIVSTNFSHYIGRTVRETIAAHGCWNLHKSYLPDYRGMAPSFHALLHRAGSTGATLHVVSPHFDDGDVLSQVRVEITPSDSVYSLNRKTAQAGGRMLLSFLERYDPATDCAHPQPPGTWKYYTYPTKEEVREFLARGLKFYRPEA